MILMFINEKGSIGSDGFLWFHGVVEDIYDPKQLGRIKVRVLGDHTQDKELIPTEDLPWSFVMMPVNSASMNGIGDSPTGIRNGSWVIGFFRDGPNKQQPIIIGTINGIPEDPPDGDVGFNDPEECFPMEERLNEPDTNRLARGEAGPGKYCMPHPVTDKRRELVLSGMATCKGSWSEPEVPYAALYPFNQTWEGWWNAPCNGDDWGHVVEWDSTPGAERYLRWHKTSMNFLEIHPDGKEVHKIFGDNFELDLASKHLLVKGDYKITVEGDRDEFIMGDYCLHVGGNYTQTVDGHKSELIMQYKEQKIIAFYSKVVGLYDNESVGAYKKSFILGYEDKTVGQWRKKEIGADDATMVHGDLIEEVTGNINETSESSILNSASSNIECVAGDAITHAAGRIQDEAETIKHIGITEMIGDTMLMGPVYAEQTTDPNCDDVCLGLGDTTLLSVTSI